MSKLLSPHFALEEFTLSQTAAREGIANTPDASALRNLQTLANVLEQVRSALGNNSVSISSGYRSKALNTAIGGSSTSAHMSGCAADLTLPAYGSVLQTARAIAASGVAFDQIIYEYGRWVHFGLAAPGTTPRRELLSIGAQKKYVSGLTTRC
jgi:zinc D-Ala-D-Ala carboxypeptidase